MGGQRHELTVLLPGKTRYPLYRRLGGPQGWYGLVQKISLPLGFDPQIVQPVVSRYTDRAIPNHYIYIDLFVFITCGCHAFIFHFMLPKRQKLVFPKACHYCEYRNHILNDSSAFSTSQIFSITMSVFLCQIKHYVPLANWLFCQKCHCSGSSYTNNCYLLCKVLFTTAADL